MTHQVHLGARVGGRAELLAHHRANTLEAVPRNALHHAVGDGLDIRGSGACTRGSSRAKCRKRWTSRPGAGRRPACSSRSLRGSGAGRSLAGSFTSVDRRALVDQSAQAVRGWVERMAAVPSLVRAFDSQAAFPAARPVALGVLRGGHADEGAWRHDPARPAVVVGTVDMVGSRLLFAGYGSGRSRRAMDAGLLGQGALVLLDEAHLAPAMAGLLDSIARLSASLRVMRLSATAPGGAGRCRTVPREHFSEVLSRIAENTSAVWDWAPPGTPVRGCLVLAKGAPPKRTTTARSPSWSTQRRHSRASSRPRRSWSA